MAQVKVSGRFNSKPLKGAEIPNGVGTTNIFFMATIAHVSPEKDSLEVFRGAF